LRHRKWRSPIADDAKTVLVVDDDPDARDYLATVLKDTGFAAVTAADGTEALWAIEHARPDLVTLDITVSEQAGVLVYRRLKGDERLKNIPVILVTGVLDDFQRFISTRRQVPPPEGYLDKPVSEGTLSRTLRRILEPSLEAQEMVAEANSTA
jgi:CheY-like chemotaxis protein